MRALGIVQLDRWAAADHSIPAGAAGNCIGAPSRATVRTLRHGGTGKSVAPFESTGESTVTHAAITGWGKCLPPAILSNDDLATFLDTNDEWITSRTGIRERRISHVSLTELAHVSTMHALAAAGLDPAAVELIVFGSCSFDDQVPNQASGLQVSIGARNAAAMDVNTACTSFLYALSTANAMIRSGVVRNAVVVGGEVISTFMDWENRGVCVLFGDGCASVVLEATEREEGVLSEAARLRQRRARYARH
jgi:3-oxoacyl-[acyl-carrier-protein] synthase-3